MIFLSKRSLFNTSHLSQCNKMGIIIALQHQLLHVTFFFAYNIIVIPEFARNTSQARPSSTCYGSFCKNHLFFVRILHSLSCLSPSSNIHEIFNQKISIQNIHTTSIYMSVELRNFNSNWVSLQET